MTLTSRWNFAPRQMLTAVFLFAGRNFSVAITRRRSLQRPEKYKPQDWNSIDITVTNNIAYCTCNRELLTNALPVPPTGPIGFEGDRGQWNTAISSYGYCGSSGNLRPDYPAVKY